jgi:hypothetical protein
MLWVMAVLEVNLLDVDLISVSRVEASKATMSWNFRNIFREHRLWTIKAPIYVWRLRSWSQPKTSTPFMGVGKWWKV